MNYLQEEEDIQCRLSAPFQHPPCQVVYAGPPPLVHLAPLSVAVQLEIESTIQQQSITLHLQALKP
jgi:hypothetical protein